jgi:hypothetical protein
MKVILLAMLILLSAFVYADLTCNWYDSTCLAGTPLLYMANYSANYTNAHAQLSNYTPHYNSVLCCNSSLAINTSPLGEGFIKLSSPTNAHVQLYNNTAYSVKYNFSAYITTNESKPLCRNYSACPSAYTCLCSISGSGTNAHIAGCNQPYSNKICCKTRQVANSSVVGPLSGVYGDILNVTCVNGPGSSDIIYTLSRNGTSVSNPDTQQLGAGSYQYTCNATNDGENYTSSTDLASANITIVKANITTIYIQNTINYTGAYPVNSSTEGGGCPLGAVCTLYYDGANVTNPYYNLIAAGNHSLVYSTPGNENYSSASVTWVIGAITNSSTTTVNTTTVVVSTGGSSSIYPILPDCIYYFSQPQYHAGDKVSLMLNCPSAYNAIFNYEWRQGDLQAVQPLILFYNTTTLRGTLANITYAPPKSGYVHININGQVIDAPFVILPAIPKSAGYIYMFLLALDMFLVIYFINMLIGYEKQHRIVSTTLDYVMGILALTSVSVSALMYITLGGNVGTIYMVLLSLIIFVGIYYLNQYIKYERSLEHDRRFISRKKDAVMLFSIASLVLGVVAYYLYNSYKGYLYMGLIVVIILMVIFILNELVAKGEKR